MKTNWLKISSAVSLVMTSALVTACGAGDMNEFDASQEDMAGEEGGYSEEMELGTTEQAAHNCATPDGTNAVMAALGVATAKELGRLRAEVDYVVAGDRIALATGNDAQGKPRGRNRCSNSCKGIDALLALQNDSATGVYVQAENSNTKVLVNPSILRGRMKAKLEEQINKAVNFIDGRTTEGAKTTHTLASAGSANLGGCGTHFKFNVTFDAPVAPPRVPLAEQLRYSLFFADQANGWIDFKHNVDNVATRIAFDPTYGLNEGSSTSAGSCEIACTKVSTNSNVANTCCSCGGVQKTFKQSTFSTSVFLCQ
jgi:hypothetical protein